MAVNEDTIEHVYRSLGVNEAENSAVAFVSLLTREAKDPVKYFSKAFKDPGSLLGIMTATKTILSGSRATEYFIGGVCNEESDWDFYTCGTEENVLLTLKLFEQVGVIWQTAAQRGSSITIHEYRGGSGVVSIQGYSFWNNRSHAVQLMYLEGENALECVLRFHSSVVQCIICGFSAISLHNRLTSKRMSVLWEENGEDTDVEQLKYKARGIRYVPLDDYEYFGYDSNILEYRNRYVGDYLCKTVNFSSYVKFLSKEDIDTLTTISKERGWTESKFKTISKPLDTNVLDHTDTSIRVREILLKCRSAIGCRSIDIRPLSSTNSYSAVFRTAYPNVQLTLSESYGVSWRGVLAHKKDILERFPMPF